MTDSPIRQQLPVHRRFQVLAVCALLLLAVAVVFGQTVGFDFVNYDDPAYVYENVPVDAGLTGQGIGWAFTHVYMGRRYDNPIFHWHPLTWISHMADCQLYGLRPGGHHLTSVVLHGATAVVLFLVLLRMTGALWPSALAAALFAIHPLRVESVAWVAERKDVLSGFFFVLTLAAYVRYARLPFSLARYSAVLALFACGLMAKPMLVTLPCVLLLLDWWPLGRLTRSSLDKQPDCPDGKLASGPLPFINPLSEKIPLFALVAAACCVTIFAQREAISDPNRFSLATRTANALVAYATYVVQFFMPVDLAAFYPHPGDGLPAWQVAGSLAALATITILAIIRRRRFPYLLVGWLWFLGMLVPVIGIVQVGSQARADRYTYLPQIGLCIALAWGAADLARSWSVPRRMQAIAAVLVLLALMAGAWRQTSYWQNSEILWRHALACTTGNWVAHDNLAAVLGKQNKTDEAIAHYEAALKIFPTHIEAHYNLGIALDSLGKTGEAMVHYEKALEMQPEYATALNAHAHAHYNLGIALDRQGKTDEAIVHYEQALAIQPNDASAHYNLGIALVRQGKTSEAMVHYRKALESPLTDASAQDAQANAHNNLGIALDRQGKTDEAMMHYRKALEFRPRLAQAHSSLANDLAGQGKLDEAIVHYEKALEIRPSEASDHDNLGMALDRQGKRTEAMIHYRKALEIQPEDTTAHYNLGIHLAGQGKLDEAIAHYEKALEAQPRAPHMLINLANALAAQGKTREAIARYEQVLTFEPQNIVAHNNLGKALGAEGRTDDAIEHYRAAVQIEPRFAVAQLNLVDALAAQGKPEAAIAECQQALGVAEAHNNGELVEILRKRLRLYRADSGSQTTR
jgi:tetratricopeptide (TPR) repeat protein